MSQEIDKTCVTQVMVKQETVHEVMGETMEQTDMVKSEDCDLDIDIKDFNVIFKQKERQDEFGLEKKEWIHNKQLTISEIKPETSETYTSSLTNDTQAEDETEEDFGLSHDCPQGNLIVDLDTPLLKRNHERRKYLFSPRHFQKDNDFTFSISSLKTPKYSHLTTKNKSNSLKPVKLVKQNSYHIRKIRNISG